MGTVGRWWWPKGLTAVDYLAIGLAVAGGIVVVVGALPVREVEATGHRILPLLVFLAAVIVLAELAIEAQLFDVIATRVTIWGRGRTALLFLLCVAFAAATTALLNLDTTAVLLTPVMLATAARARVAALPLAMTTVWLANGASLLLPVSNLTNLLASDRIGLSPIGFAERMFLPQAAAVATMTVCLWWFHWRGSPRRYDPPTPFRPRDRRVFTAASLAVGAFVVALVAGVSIYWTTPICAAGLLLAFAVWDRSRLGWRLVPWQLLVSVAGLFLVVDAVSRHGLSSAMTTLIGTDPGPAGISRAAGTGAVLSNVLNNLPVYRAGEAVVPIANHNQLLGLLIGTNVAPLISPWASLATLLWAQRCRAAGVDIRWSRFALTGAVTALLVTAASTASLIAWG